MRGTAIKGYLPSVGFSLAPTVFGSKGIIHENGIKANRCKMGYFMRNHWPESTSVVVLLENFQKRAYWKRDLVLVRKRESGLWSTISGHVERSDYSPIMTGLRELREETGINENMVAHFGLIIPEPVVFVVTDTKTSIGIRCMAELIKEMPIDGYSFNSDEIDYVMPWPRAALWNLVEVEGDRLYKQEFNVPLIRHYLEQNIDPWVNMQSAQ